MAPLTASSSPVRLATNGEPGSVSGSGPADPPAITAAKARTADAKAVETVVAVTTESIKAVALINASDRSHAALMGDAPACDVCGAITVRNGTCYRCMNCGNTMGCS